MSMHPESIPVMLASAFHYHTSGYYKVSIVVTVEIFLPFFSCLLPLKIFTSSGSDTKILGSIQSPEDTTHNSSLSWCLLLESGKLIMMNDDDD